MTALEMVFWVWVVVSLSSQIYMMAKMALKMAKPKVQIELRCTPSGKKLHRARCEKLREDAVVLRFCADCFSEDGFTEDASGVSFLEDRTLHSVLACPKILGQVKQMNLCKLCTNSKLRVD